MKPRLGALGSEMKPRVGGLNFKLKQNPSTKFSSSKRVAFFNQRKQSTKATVSQSVDFTSNLKQSLSSKSLTCCSHDNTIDHDIAHEDHFREPTLFGNDECVHNIVDVNALLKKTADYITQNTKDKPTINYQWENKPYMNNVESLRDLISEREQKVIHERNEKERLEKILATENSDDDLKLNRKYQYKKIGKMSILTKPI